MSRSGYNRLRGRSLYLEVRDIIRGSDKALSNIDVRDILGKRYPEDAGDAEQLYLRIKRATEQLLQDGHLQREIDKGRTNTTIYLYTHTPDPACHS